ncbi:MAG: hypothetical protein ABJA10_09145 [Aestuariivirga sp.]
MPIFKTRIFTLIFLGAVALFLSGAVPGTPEECKDGASAEKTLSACTAYIDSSQYKGKDLAAAYYLRAIAHSSFEESDQAQSDIAKAIELDPDNAQLYFVRGNIQWATGSAERNEKAVLADYDKAISLKPDSALYFVSRCYAYAALREAQPKLALADCKKALELDPENENAAALIQQVEESAKASP